MNVQEYKDDPRVCWTWPPNFTEVYRRRVELLNKMRADPVMRAAVLKHYESNPVDFILDWATTYDPRKKGDIPKRMPFCLFPRQIELVWFLQDCIQSGESGLIEKCRDAGATFVCAAFSVWQWLFVPGSSTGFGSRKEILVDRLGDPDSIFQKIRDMIEMLPPDIFWPQGFNPARDMPSMKIINPENGAQITGEAGDNIGRGGRKSTYFKDESAHYERPELIEASLGDNTDVQIDISSVNGTGNVFYRRRKAGVEWEPGKFIEPGKTRVFIFDWRDHPGKNQEWYEKRRAKAEAEGLLHVFAQEVDRDYSSAVLGVLIPSKWVKACIDIHKDLKWPAPTGRLVAAMDVADGGNDRNSMTLKKGYLVRASMCDGGEADTIARQYYGLADMVGADEWRYEVNGVGAGAKAAARSYVAGQVDNGRKESSLPSIVAWYPTGAIVNPGCDIVTGQPVEPGDKESIRNKDFYHNLRSQAAFTLRRLCHNSYRVRYEGADIDPDDCLALDSDMEGLEELVTELSQPTYTRNPNTGKVLIDKKPEGTTSPNRFDSLMIAVSPMRPEIDTDVVVGGHGIDSVDYVAVG